MKTNFNTANRSDAELKSTAAACMRKFQKMASLDALAQAIRIFYRNNKDLMKKHKQKYNGMWIRGEHEDTIQLFRSIIREFDPNPYGYDFMLTNEDIEYMAPAFINMLSNQSQRKFDKEWKTKMAREQNYICPICGRAIPESLIDVQFDHERSFCVVGDYAGTPNIRVVHRECNQRKHASVIARRGLFEYRDA